MKTVNRTKPIVYAAQYNGENADELREVFNKYKETNSLVPHIIDLNQRHNFKHFEIGEWLIYEESSGIITSFDNDEFNELYIR